jgi:hypothetical protein
MGVCTANLGFLHEYGTVAPNCALDVSQDTYVVGSPSNCLADAGSCSVYPQDDVLGTGADYANGTTLPGPTYAGFPAPAGYPADPCVGIYKRLYIQATCGTCN